MAFKKARHPSKTLGLRFLAGGALVWYSSNEHSVHPCGAGVAGPRIDEPRGRQYEALQTRPGGRCKPLAIFRSAIALPCTASVLAPASRRRVNRSRPIRVWGQSTDMSIMPRRGRPDWKY